MHNIYGGLSRPKAIVIFVALCSLVFGLLVAGNSPAHADDPAPSGGNDSSLSVRKEVSHSEVKAGEVFEYDLYVTCSSHTTTCKDVELTDTFDSSFQVTPPGHADEGGTVNWNAGTNTLKINWASLRDGSQVHVKVGVVALEDGIPQAGKTITNTANVTASNAEPKSDSADVFVTVERKLLTSGTLNINPDVVYAQSEVDSRRSTVIASVKNDSTKITPVKELRIDIANDNPANEDLFNYFDVHGSTANSAGTLTQRPTNADHVVVEAFANGTWHTSAPQTGTALELPAGVTSDQVQGLRYIFKSSSNEDIATTQSEGKVQFGLELRDNERGDNTEINPPAQVSLNMKMVPTLVGEDNDNASQTIYGSERSDNISINPNKVKLTPTHNFFVPSGANVWSTSGSTTTVDEGATSNATSLVGLKNDSGFAINNMSIAIPQSGSNLGAFKPTHYRVLLPSGAVKAIVTIKCLNDPQPSVVEYDSNQNSVASPCTGAGNKVTEGTVTFTSGADDQFLIAKGATGTFGFTGALDGTQTGGNPVWNVIGYSATNPVPNTGGTVSGTSEKAIGVITPNYSVGGVTKTVSNGVSTVVPGDALQFNLSYKNNGNKTIAKTVLRDPVNPASDPAPWNILEVVSVSAPSSTIHLYDPLTSAWVAYDANNAALLKRATGVQATRANLAVDATASVTIIAKVREGIPTNEGIKITNCAAVSVNDGPFGAAGCLPGSGITIREGGAQATIQKSFGSAEVDRVLPGMTGQTVKTQIKAQNDGPQFLKNLWVEDRGIHDESDVNFFDAVNFEGSTVFLNRPNGATHAKVFLCDFGAACEAGTWVAASNFVAVSSNNQTVAIDKNVVTRVGGVKVQFATNSTGTGEALITTGFNNQTGASNVCRYNTICFNVKPRATLATDENTLIPSEVFNGISGEAEVNPLPGSGTTKFDVPPHEASFRVVEGKPKLHLTKTPNGKINPGGKHEFTLTYKNVGTGIVTNPKLVDNLPAELDLDLTNGYTVEYDRPSELADPAAPTFSTLPGGVGEKVTKITLKWNDWEMLPGDEVVVKYTMSLQPGTPGGQQVVNVAGITADEFTSVDGGVTVPGIPQPCQATKGSMSGESLNEVYCIDDAYVETQSGNGFSSSKWVAGNADLGFYNTNSGAYVPLDSATCPKIEVDSKTFTRFPCVALVGPGEKYDYVLRHTNSGTNPVPEVRVIDGLPVQGDKGVIINTDRGTDWTNRPTLASEVTAPARDGMTAEIGYNDSLEACTTSLTSPNATGCDWGAYNGSASGSFQAHLTFAEGKLLNPGETVDLKLAMDTPYDVGDEAALPIAWNSIAQNVWAKEPSGNIRELHPSEPNKVGVGMLHAQLDVEKVVELQGDTSEFDTQSAFPVKYKCVKDDFTLEGDGEINPGQVTTLTKGLFPGVECDIWETDARGAQSNGSEGDPLKVTIPAFEIDYGLEDAITVPPTSVGFGQVTNVFTEVPPTEGPSDPAETPAVTPSASNVSEGPDDGPADAPSAGDPEGDDPQGALAQSGAGIALLIALAALILIGSGLVAMRLGQNRRH